MYKIDPGYRYTFDEEGNLITRLPSSVASEMENEGYSSFPESRSQTPAEWELQRLAQEQPSKVYNEGEYLVHEKPTGDKTFYPNAQPKQSDKKQGMDALEEWNDFWERARPEAENLAMREWGRVESELWHQGVSPLERRRKAESAYNETLKTAKSQYKDLFTKQWALETEAKKNEREKGEEEGRYQRRQKDWEASLDRRESRAGEKQEKRDTELEKKQSIQQVNDFYNKTHNTLSDLIKQRQAEGGDASALLTSIQDLDVKRANDVTRVRRGEDPIDMKNMSEWLSIRGTSEDVGGGRYVPKAQRGAKQSTKSLDKDTARSFLKQAGGDKEKARKLAREQGYTF